jgi:hypothetical protein
MRQMIIRKPTPRRRAEPADLRTPSGKLLPF